MIEPKRSIRSDVLEQSPPARSGEGVAYRIEYGVRTSTSAPVIWIEETGCWFAGPDASRHGRKASFASITSATRATNN